MEFQSIKTSKLNKKQINEILCLKNLYWVFGEESQKIWFKKNAFLNDTHNLMVINNEIVGYTFLSNRNLKIYHLNKLKNNLSYTLFSTLILKEKYRNYFYVSRMMNFNSEIILKKRKISFLLCRDEFVKFYKFFGWHSLQDSSFKVTDHNSNLNGMVYNFDKLHAHGNLIYNFFYYS